MDILTSIFSFFLYMFGYALAFIGLLFLPLGSWGVAFVFFLLYVGRQAKSCLWASFMWLGVALWNWWFSLSNPQNPIRVDLVLLLPVVIGVTIWAAKDFNNTKVPTEKNSAYVLAGILAVLLCVLFLILGKMMGMF